MARLWIALVVLLLAAATANAFPIDMPANPDVADVAYDDTPIVEPVTEPVADVRVTRTIPIVDESLPASVAGEDVFRPPRLSND